MVDAYLRQSALASRHLPARATALLGDAGIGLSERPHGALINLHGDLADGDFLAGVQEVLGIAPPGEPNTLRRQGDFAILWLGPDEWWIKGPPGAEGALAGRLREALASCHAAIVDVTDTRTIIRIVGRSARALLAKGCTLDLHPRVFGPDRCAQSGLAKAGVLIHQLDDEPTFDVYVLRSFADYLWTWLEDAAAEYAPVVLAD